MSKQAVFHSYDKLPEGKQMQSQQVQSISKIHTVGKSELDQRSSPGY